VQAASGWPAIVDLGREVADELASCHRCAERDDRVHRLVREVLAADRDGDHLATGEGGGVDDGAGRSRVHRLAGGCRQVDTAVTGAPALRRGLEAV
jgi:hypothetical protein